MVNRFIEVLDCLDTTSVDAGLLDRLPRPGRVGAVRVGGIDINRPRTRAVMQALLELSPNPAGFTSSELAAKVARLLKERTVRAEQRRPRPEEVPLQGSGRQDPAFTPVLRGS